MFGIDDSKFKQDLKNAIEMGEDHDYDYNGEDEIRIDFFDSDIALKSVLELLQTNKLYTVKEMIIAYNIGFGNGANHFYTDQETAINNHFNKINKP